MTTLYRLATICIYIYILSMRISSYDAIGSAHTRNFRLKPATYLNLLVISSAHRGPLKSKVSILPSIYINHVLFKKQEEKLEVRKKKKKSFKEWNEEKSGGDKKERKERGDEVWLCNDQRRTGASVQPVVAITLTHQEEEEEPSISERERDWEEERWGKGNTNGMGGANEV